MGKNLVLIDADSLCYSGAKDDTVPQIIEKVDSKIAAILEETKADFYGLFISKGKYFRHFLKTKSESSGSYKSNRRYEKDFSLLIKEYLIAKYNAIYMNGVEADDFINYLYNQRLYAGLPSYYQPDDPFKPIISNKCEPDIFLNEFEEVNTIIASIDKDLLKAIGGKHLNYNKKTSPETWELVWEETNEVDASEFIWYQMLMGDPADGVLGIRGLGPKKTQKLIEEETSKGILLPHIVLAKYLETFGSSQGIYEYQKNYRLLHLLEDDSDFMREVGRIPEIPEFQFIKKESDEIETEF